MITEAVDRKVEMDFARQRIAWYQGEVAKLIRSGEKWGWNWKVLGRINWGDGKIGLLILTVGLDSRPLVCRYFLAVGDGQSLRIDECRFESSTAHVRYMEYYDSTGRVVVDDEVKIPVRMGCVERDWGRYLRADVFQEYPESMESQVVWWEDLFRFWLEAN